METEKKEETSEEKIERLETEIEDIRAALLDMVDVFENRVRAMEMTREEYAVFRNAILYIYV
jgi:peptidoglycan hydrolase CwlO-like protein